MTKFCLQHVVTSRKFCRILRILTILEKVVKLTKYDLLTVSMYFLVLHVAIPRVNLAFRDLNEISNNNKVLLNVVIFPEFLRHFNFTIKAKIFAYLFTTFFLNSIFNLNFQNFLDCFISWVTESQLSCFDQNSQSAVQSVFSDFWKHVRKIWRDSMKVNKKLNLHWKTKTNFDYTILVDHFRCSRGWPPAFPALWTKRQQL